LRLKERKKAWRRFKEEGVGLNHTTTGREVSTLQFCLNDSDNLTTYEWDEEVV